MTAEGETKVTVESMSRMVRGAFKEGELETENELDSGKMSIYTGVRVSGMWFRLDDDMAGLYCVEGMDESADEEVDELSLVEESEDKGEGEASSKLWL